MVTPRKLGHYERESREGLHNRRMNGTQKLLTCMHDKVTDCLALVSGLHKNSCMKIKKRLESAHCQSRTAVDVREWGGDGGNTARSSRNGEQNGDMSCGVGTGMITIQVQVNSEPDCA